MDRDCEKEADTFYDGLLRHPDHVRVAVDPESRFRVGLFMCDLRSAHNPRTIRFPCLIQSFRVLLVTRPGARPIDRVLGA